MSSDFEPEMDPLPTHDRNAELEWMSIQALNNALPVDRFLYRREPAPDAGVDGAIELLLQGRNTNRRARVQLKATDSDHINLDGSHSRSVATSNLNYLLNDPSALYILYIVPRNELRYAWADDERRRIEAEKPDWRQQATITIRFVELLTSDSLDAIYGRIEREARWKRTAIESMSQGEQAGTVLLVGEPSRGVIRPLEPGDLPTLPGTADREAVTQIDLARDLLAQGRCEAARQILTRLQTSDGYADLAPTLRARVANVLGVTALEVDAIADARDHFRTALELDHANPKYLANDAMAALMLGSVDEALCLSRQAWEADPQGPNIVSVYLQVLHRAGDEATVERIVTGQEWVGDDPARATALAFIRYDQRRYAEALDAITVALTNHETDPQLYTLKANVLLASVKELPLFGAIPLDRFEPSVRQRLVEAEQSLTRAIGLLEVRENVNSLHIALTNRASVRHVLGLEEAAVRDCDRVLAREPDHIGALENKARTLLDTGKPAEAVPLLEQAYQQDRTQPPAHYARVDPEGDMETALLLAQAYLQARQGYKVLPLLSPLWKPDSERRLHLAIAELMLIAASEVQNAAEITRIQEAILQRWSEAADALAMLAEQAFREGDREKAIRGYEEAAKRADEPIQERMSVRLADLYMQQHRYSEAADLYARYASLERRDTLLRRFIQALYLSERWQEALACAVSFRERFGVVEGIANLEARIRESYGDLKAAQELFLQLNELALNKVEYRVEAAFLAWRRESLTEARELLSSVTVEACGDDIDLLLNLARLRAMLKIPNALAAGYEARRRAYGNPIAHATYLSLCFHVKGPEEMAALCEPPEVAINTAAHLERNGQKTVFVLLDLLQVHPERGELSVYDPRAQNLLGRKKGERVTLGEGIMGAQEYTITAIQSHLLYACHQTIDLYARGILHDANFHADDVNAPDFIPRLILSLERSSENVEAILTAYRDQFFPLSTVACLRGRTFIETWQALLDWPGRWIYVSLGSPEETTEQEATLQEATTVVMDLLAILTVIHLGLEEEISQRFEKILVAQSVLDEVREYRMKLDGPEASGTMGSNAGRLHFVEMPAGYLEEQRAFLNRLMTFLQEKTHVTPTPGLLTQDDDRKEALGEYALASILLAQEHKVPLYSDDVRLRVLARNEWKVPGFDIQNLLRDLYKKDQLSFTEYVDHLGKLADANYQFLRIDTDGLMEILKANEMAISNRLRNMLRYFQGPDCTLESAISALGELIKRVWLRNEMLFRKSTLLDLVLDTLTTNRTNRRRVVQDFLRDIQARMHLAPVQWIEIHDHIQVWLHMRSA